MSLVIIVTFTVHFFF